MDEYDIGIAFLSNGDGLARPDGDDIYFAIELLFKVGQDESEQAGIVRTRGGGKTQKTR